MQITIPVPARFNFKRTALSHGWYDLPPFTFDKDSWTLTRVIDLNGAKPVTVAITADNNTIIATTPQKLNKRSEAKVINDIRHCLRLDDEMQAFYDSVAKDAEFAWIAQTGAGRLLRSPNVFEDLVKTIC